jgi:NADPH:quinone reductase-like Zn-dependent oxidoreductase
LEFDMDQATNTGTATTTMTAAVHRRFGPPEVVHLERVPKPRPRPDELLVRVHASTVSIADHRTRSRDLPKGLWFFGPIALGVFRPRKRVLGMDLAGVVDSVGDQVVGFAPGDEVIAMLGRDFGGHAEYARVPQAKAIALKPRNLDMGAAAALVFGGHTALAFLDLVQLGPGSEVLVNGASSAVGSAAVQLATARGATVTAVCGARNVALASELGAARVIDYGAEDFTRAPGAYDVIVDCVGNASFDRVEHLLKPGGALLLVIADLSSMRTAKRNSRRSGRLVTFTGAPVTHDDLAGLVRLAEQGRVRPVIDRTYAFDEVVEAHRYVDGGHKTGNVVLRIA